MIEQQINLTTDQLVFLLMFQKYMKDVFTVSFALLFSQIYRMLLTVSISHLIAKLNVDGFHQNSLKLICDYLSDRSQKSKVGSSVPIYGVPHGSIL